MTCFDWCCHKIVLVAIKLFSSIINIFVLRDLDSKKKNGRKSLILSVIIGGNKGIIVLYDISLLPQ